MITVYAKGLTYEVFDKPAAPPGPSVFANLPVNTLRNAGTYIDTEQADWTQKSRNIGDDSGAVFDQVADELIMFGGAHGPMQASNPRAFSVTTGKWRNMHLSTPYANMLAANADMVKGRWIDTNSPIARHTYSQQVVTPAVGTRPRRLYEMSAYLNADNLPGPSLPFVYGKIAWMDLEGPNAKKWTFGNVGPQPWYFAGGAVYDAISDCIYIVSMRHVGGALEDARIWRYDIAGDSYTEGPVVGVKVQPLDVQWGGDGKLYVFENGGVVRCITVDRANLANTTAQLLTTTGPKPVGPNRPFGYPACCWVPHRARFGGWFAGGNYYEFSPATLTWTATQMALEAGSFGSNIGVIFSCLGYSEKTQCFVFLDTENVQKTWVYRPPAVVIPPPPPPPVTIPVVGSFPVNTTNLVVLAASFNGGGGVGSPPGGMEYERYQRPLILNTASTRLDFWRSVSGTPSPFLHTRYALFMSPNPDMTGAKVIAATNVTGKAGFFNAVPASPDGSYFLRILPVDAADVPVTPLETYPVKGCTVNVGGTAKNCPTMTVDNGSYSWTHGVGKSFAVLMPKNLPLIPAPLPVRDVVSAFSTNLPPTSIGRVQLVPNTDAIDQDRHHRCVVNGITVTENKQGYVPELMFDRWPRLQIKSGPRGVGSFPIPITGIPGRNGKIYTHNPHALAVVDTTGDIKVLVGLEHVEPPYWESPIQTAADPRVIIRGNWDPAIPVDKRYPWECWGFGWDQRSLVLDPNAAPIGGEQPHSIGPTSFATCRHGRVLRYRFSANNRSAPAMVDEWITGLNDPWGLVTTLGNTIIVAERGSHRISEWSMDTPNTKIRDILSTPQASAAGSVPTAPRRFAGSVGSATTRAYDCCAPEGLALMDEWLYFGSLAQSEVRRVNLITGALEKGLAFPTINLTSVGSYFVNIAVSDGTFGPKGTIFCTTFYNSQHGHPEAFLPVPIVPIPALDAASTTGQAFRLQGGRVDLPAGTAAGWRIDLSCAGGSLLVYAAGVLLVTMQPGDARRFTVTSGAYVVSTVPYNRPWDYTGYGYGLASGKGGGFNGGHYPTLVACGGGRLYAGDSGGGLDYFCKADAYDGTTSAAAVQRGWDKHRTSGDSLIYGPYCTTVYHPLRTGDADLTAFYKSCGR